MSYLKQYEYIIAIANSGGISQAAEKLNISQPTLSKFLKKLESDLEAELFDRTTIPIRLTQAGECYIQMGRKMVDLEYQMKKQLLEIKENKNTTIRVGISPSRFQYLMPQVIELYKKENPEGRIIIEERTSAELNKRLASGKLDLIISLSNEETQYFERIDLFEEEIFLAISKNNLKNQDSLPNILCSVPLISVGRGQQMWYMMNEIVQAVGATQPQIECQSIESALTLVKRNLGAMLVPSYIVDYATREQCEKLAYKKIPENILSECATVQKRNVCLFYRKGQFLTRAESSFITSMCSMFKKEKMKI